MPGDLSTSQTVRAQIAALETMTLAELRAAYQRVFGEPTYSRHKTYVRKRVAWGLQVRQQGGLTPRAQARVAALADETHLHQRVPGAVAPAAPPRDALPVGTQLVKDYHGTRHVVTVLAQGYAYDGQTYRSLTAVAAAITGTHRNGRAFFGLAQAGGGR